MVIQRASMTQYEPVIGLEIHAELLTNSKMFCSCSAAYALAEQPNLNICPVCTGLPGAMPVVNGKAVEHAVSVGLALNCAINEHNTFARKNYYYPDLPKGYQISQYELPIGEMGWLDLNPPLPAGEGPGVRVNASASEMPGSENQLRVRVRRVHIEEDTAKLAHEKKYALVDFNRAGVPLLEIVSEPDMQTVDQVLSYATQIRAILRYLGVNSGDMEKGVLRFEANISVRPTGSEELRTRTEIKNLNSFRALTRASAYEIERQISVYEGGGTVIQETLGWDDGKGVTLSQRSKEHAHDYRYFPEPDLPPLQLKREWIAQLRSRLPELPAAKKERFVGQYQLKHQEAIFLAADKALADYFEEVVKASKSPARTVNRWIAGEVMRHVNDLNLDPADIPIPPASLAKLIDMVASKSVNANAGKTILSEMFRNGGDPEKIAMEKNLAQVSDEGYIQEIIAKILDENPKEVDDYLAGKEAILQWLMGQVARATKGKADPIMAREKLIKELQGRRKLP